MAETGYKTENGGRDKKEAKVSGYKKADPHFRRRSVRHPKRGLTLLVLSLAMIKIE
jgi:hypothetical protein